MTWWIEKILIGVAMGLMIYLWWSDDEEPTKEPPQ